MNKRHSILLILSAFFFLNIYAQNRHELAGGWQCRQSSLVQQSGEQLSQPSALLTGWKPAVVPGTVLTSLLFNNEIPDPFYGMNNKLIPDIFDSGKAKYTYWFVKDFVEQASSSEQVWLYFRGINYSCDVYLNGTKLNAITHKGMFLSQTYNISSLLQGGNNRLAVIVYPPDEVGNPNGGQGGDGTIAKNVTHQYVAGWDWIQPIRDRNTGIWDKVFIEKTGSVNVRNVHVVTQVPGVRMPQQTVQQPAVIKLSAELENPTNLSVSGRLFYTLGRDTISKNVIVPVRSTLAVSLPDFTLNNPKLWWPNTYGDQNLYTVHLQFISNSNVVSDDESTTFGVREIQTEWNITTRSKEVRVNGQQIFIRGGNWIISDAMLRFSKERYDAEIRFHKDMNLNLIRVWGGAILERPEFYDACDKYGLLVMQDFWGSGDCNGRWVDPQKKDDQWTRRKYPDDHRLFLASAADGIKLIRNHPSLAIWCGGNEITLPEDIFHPLKDSLIPALDGTRWFIDYSNSDSMSYNFIGGNGDGPYSIQSSKTFFGTRTFPFNSEVGSVGLSDYASLQRFIPDSNMRVPQFENGRNTVDSVWDYHKYMGYNNYISAYGNATTVPEFAKKAQLANYDQYRALIEGFTAHMWDWYTGVIIWKTQNPWTAMRGQMYDYYLDPNACLYGLKTAGEPLHILFNAADSVVMIANNTFQAHRDMMLQIMLYDMKGNSKLLTQVFSEIGPTTVKRIFSIRRELSESAKDSGAFVVLRLLNTKKEIISDNLYWLPDATGNYSGLQAMDKTELITKAIYADSGKIEVILSNPAGKPIAFFNRLSLIDGTTKKRILPSFYSDNYVSVLPGETKTIKIDYTDKTNRQLMIEAEGWNTDVKDIPVEE